MSNVLDNANTAEDVHLLTGDRSPGRGGFWETRTTCERRLCIVAVIMICFIIILAATLAILEESEHKLSDSRLHKLTEELISIDKDNNNVFHELNVTLKGKTLLSGPSRIYSGMTIAPMVNLQYDFHPDVNVAEIFSDKHEKKLKNFLTAVMDTKVMETTEKVLKETDLIKKPLVEVLEDIWFGLYSRSAQGVNGSSGFEHVFAGEIKNNQVSGFHNWVYFLQEQDNPQKHPNLTYIGYDAMLGFGDKGDLIGVKFKWLPKYKKTSSMFIGTSPELEMAVYTICFLARPNKDCHVSMTGKHFTIKTFTFKDTRMIGSAYPDMKKQVTKDKSKK